MDRNIDYYLVLPFTIELIPDLPAGCMTDADTAEEALKEIRELQREWLEIAVEEGLEIPEPRTADPAGDGG